MDQTVVKVLKALAEYLGLTLGDLVEGIVLHAFDGKVAFSDETLSKISMLREVYDLRLRSDDAHLLTED
jgi:hypothetical protein